MICFVLGFPLSFSSTNFGHRYLFFPCRQKRSKASLGTPTPYSPHGPAHNPPLMHVCIHAVDDDETIVCANWFPPTLQRLFVWEKKKKEASKKKNQF